MIKLPQILIYL